MKTIKRIPKTMDTKGAVSGKGRVPKNPPPPLTQGKDKPSKTPAKNIKAS